MSGSLVPGGSRIDWSGFWSNRSASGGVRLMNASVGRVRQVPSATRSSTQADTSRPRTTPSSGTTAPTTTRAGTPSRIAASAITVAYCSSSPVRLP